MRKLLELSDMVGKKVLAADEWPMSISFTDKSYIVFCGDYDGCPEVDKGRALTHKEMLRLTLITEAECLARIQQEKTERFVAKEQTDYEKYKKLKSQFEGRELEFEDFNIVFSKSGG